MGEASLAVDELCGRWWTGLMGCKCNFPSYLSMHSANETPLIDSFWRRSIWNYCQNTRTDVSSSEHFITFQNLSAKRTEKP